jgi:hypothetical protein
MTDNKDKKNDKILQKDSVAIGNESLTIIKHAMRPFSRMRGFPDVEHTTWIDMTILNTTDKTIATAIFEGIFFDINGNVLEKIKHTIYELKPNCSRVITVVNDITRSELIKSYKIGIVKTVTADIERIQIQKHTMRKNADGGVEIWGILKNISAVKTNVSVILTVNDFNNEKIGKSVLVIEGIDPESYKKFSFIFNAPDGDAVSKYSLEIAEESVKV